MMFNYSIESGSELYAFGWYKWQQARQLANQPASQPASQQARYTWTSNVVLLDCLSNFFTVRFGLGVHGKGITCKVSQVQ
jgi:hypothetical protein